MAKRNVTVTEKLGGGSGTKKASSGSGFTATQRDKTGKVISTKSGTLTPVSESEFKSNGKMKVTKKPLVRTVSRSTPTTRTSPKAKTERKIY